MRLLILGGTSFLGRALAEAALERGHETTLFTRGQTNPELFPEAERLIGDRAGDLSALGGRTWDAVLDTSGHEPRVVAASAGLLAGAAGLYAFVSSISVYASFARPGQDETAPTLPPGDDYGARKAACERDVEEAFPGRALVVRPGLIVGPHDPTDRFTYWPRRIAEGGEALAPGKPERPVQFIDVRDLAEWMLGLVEAGATGTFNATSPPGAPTMGGVLEACGEADVVWVDDRFLLDAGVEQWSDLPLWISATDPDWAGFMLVDVSRARAAGLTFRPLAETVRDVPEWTGKAGLTRERERELLAAWRARA